MATSSNKDVFTLYSLSPIVYRCDDTPCITYICWRHRPALPISVDDTSLHCLSLLATLPCIVSISVGRHPLALPISVDDTQGRLQYRPGCTTLCGWLIHSFSSVIKTFLQYFSIEDTHFMNESFIKISRTFVKSQADPGLEQ